MGHTRGQHGSHTHARWRTLSARSRCDDTPCRSSSTAPSEHTVTGHSPGGSTGHAPGGSTGHTHTRDGERSRQDLVVTTRLARVPQQR